MARYVATGAINTVLGLAVIWALLRAGVPDVPANGFGYVGGLLVSFLLNRTWTFEQASRPTLGETARFAGVFAIAYGVNLAILLAGLRLGLAGNPFLHLTAITAYSLVGFFLARSLIYAPGAKAKGTLPISSASVLLVSAVAACLIIPGMPITHDVVWQFWIARQLNNGVELYAQINEINPPLWFWMAMPIDRLGSWLGADPIVLVQLAMIALSSVCYLLSDRLLPELEKHQKLFFLFNAFALGLVIALGNFAQREQIAMIVALPYTLMIVRRAQGERVPSGLALGVGLLAAVGIALKHYFIAVPLLLELWVVVATRRNYRPFRPETLAFAAAASCYALAVWQFAPAYITHQLPMVLAAYEGYSLPIIALISDRPQVLWLMCILVFVLRGWLRRECFTPLTIGLWITTAGFLFSYVAQEKGWTYHSMPVTFFLLLTLIATALRSYREQPDRSRFVVPLLVLAIGYFFPIYIGPYHSRFATATNDAMVGTPRGSTVFILSSAAQRSWPMVVENGYVWPARFMSLWMIPAIASGAGDKAELQRVSDEIRQATVEDLQCNPPATLLVERLPLNGILGELKFDYVAYFTENPDAKRLMDKYVLVRTTRQFLVYRQRPGATFEVREGCRKIY